MFHRAILIGIMAFENAILSFYLMIFDDISFYFNIMHIRNVIDMALYTSLHIFMRSTNTVRKIIYQILFALRNYTRTFCLSTLKNSLICVFNLCAISEFHGSWNAQARKSKIYSIFLFCCFA